MLSKLIISQFLKRTVEYLEYILIDQGIAPSERHVEAIKKIPVPKNIHEIQRFLGLVSFFLDSLRWLNHLICYFKKSSTFEFNEQCITALKKLKSSLEIRNVLPVRVLRC